jgi:ankyrin repeat protein
MQLEKSKQKKSGLDKFLSCGGKRAKHSARMQDFTQLPVSRVSPVGTVSDTESNMDITSLIDRYTRILHQLIDAGCDIDRMENTFGLTALDMSILLGDIESTAVLVAAGGDYRHLMRTFALSELFDAIVTVDKKQVKQLLAYDVDLDVNQAFCEFNESQKTPSADVQQYRYQGLTPLALAAQVSALEVFDIIKLLQKHGL